MSQSHFYHLSPRGKLERLGSFEEAVAAAKGEGFVWLDYFNPAREELSALIEPFGIHPLTIEDCTDTNQVPKIEDFPGNTFLIFNAFNYADSKLSVFEVDLIIAKDFLITVSGFDCDNQCPLAGIEAEVEKSIENAKQGPAFLMHVILDQIVDEKFLAIEALEVELDGAEDSIMDESKDFNPSELIRLRRDLLALRKSLFHEREILVKICRKDCAFIQDKAIFHYRDIYDHLSKFFELTETYREIVTSLIEVYMSMLNNKMANISNQMNSTVRRLTFITTVFMPLTLLAGVGGMSEYSMMTGPENWKFAYPVFLLAMGVIGVISYYILRGMDK